MGPEPPSSRRDKPSGEKFRAVIGIAIAGVLLTLALFVGLFFLGDAALRHLRDVSIVFLAALSGSSLLLTVVLLMVLLWGVQRLTERVDTLLGQGGEVLERVKGTAGTVKATTDFVGERVASPFIRFSAWATGVGEGIRTFLGGKKRAGG
jgi:membrane protein implicated in regulation of membrane protease activity